MRRFLLVLFLLLGVVITSEGRHVTNEGGTGDVEDRGRQLETGTVPIIIQSLLNRGVYFSDERFNAFTDGVMVNMVSEMRRRKLDPLYFRISNDGSIEQAPTALGGGIIAGLSNIKRFGNAEVQIAGNITLIRSHWLMGPVNIIVDYRGEPSVTRVRTKIEALQFDTLTSIDRFGAEKAAFRLNSPLFGYMPYYGNRTLNQQKLTELAVKHLFSETSFVAKYLEEAFEVASYDKIIPQFGADDNYYSVIQYLFNGQHGRSPRLPIMQQLLKKYKELQSSQSEFQKRMGQPASNDKSKATPSDTKTLDQKKRTNREKNNAENTEDEEQVSQTLQKESS